MRLKAWAILSGALLLFFVTGMRPDALPYIPGVPFSDAVIAHYPNALYFRAAMLEDYAFPLWRETMMAGQPFAANPLNKTAYPLQWLVLAFPTVLHLNLMIALHLLIGGGGIWRWMRTIGAREAAAAFSAFAYAFAPRVMAQLGAGHLDVIYAMAWFPWLLWAVHEAFAIQGQHALAATAHMLRTSLIAALLFLADVRVSLFAFVAASVYAIVLFWQAQRWIPVFTLLVSMLPFVLLTTALTVPLLSWSPYLSRAGLTSEDASFLALRWGDLISLVLPVYGFQHEQFTYFGLLVLGLAAAALALEPAHKRLLWLAGMGLVILYAAGPLWLLLVKLVPALMWFRVPARVWLILVVLLPMLAGWGIHRLLEWQSNPVAVRLEQRRWRLIIFAGVLFVLAMGGAALFVRPLAAGGLGLLLVAVPLGILLLLFVNGQINNQRLAIGLGVVLLVDLSWSANHWVEWRSPAAWLHPQSALAEHLRALNPQRIYSPTYSLEQQAAEAYNLRTFGGVDPFQLSGVVDAIERGSGVAVEGYHIALPPLLDSQSPNDFSDANQSAVIDTAVLGAWGVSHVIAAYPIDHPHLALVEVFDEVYIYANTDSVRPLTGAVPDWAAAWEGLPDAAEVQRLNDLTLMATWVSGVTFVVCAGGLLVLKLRANV